MIVEYDASWPLRFEAAAVELRSASGGAWLVEHIGSTSIECLAAKPTIDLAVRVDHLSDVDQHSAQLSDLGWFGLAAGPKSHRVLVKQDGDRRTHIVQDIVERARAAKGLPIVDIHDG